MRFGICDCRARKWPSRAVSDAGTLDRSILIRAGRTSRRDSLLRPASVLSGCIAGSPLDRSVRNAGAGQSAAAWSWRDCRPAWPLPPGEGRSARIHPQHGLSSAAMPVCTTWERGGSDRRCRSRHDDRPSTAPRSGSFSLMGSVRRGRLDLSILLDDFVRMDEIDRRMR
jgi:hypothetical protein